MILQKKKTRPILSYDDGFHYNSSSNVEGHFIPLKRKNMLMHFLAMAFSSPTVKFTPPRLTASHNL
jgi:hypothetical protein